SSGYPPCPLLGQVLVCTQYSLLYAFRLFIRDVQFFLVVWLCNCVHVSDFCCLIVLVRVVGW
ncbi:uncharacterized protein EI90DRAFT_3039597, partial [Cantharellus anzutake]|uniref:uncharacterized protein n=1 Tax=Cantharellus anzutake TaxID=1750568 RepID=UPI0019079B8E